MSKRFPVTPATTLLRKLGVQFNEHLYDYQRKGSDVAVEQMGVDLHLVVKTSSCRTMREGPSMCLCTATVR
jgi:prolyl-tRNA editing enzyme YbaK/EbsC (Cys-tRNA(Pro) deacylase)